MARRLFYVLDIIEKDKITIHYVPTELNVADIGTKFLSTHRYLIGLIKNFKG